MYLVMPNGVHFVFQINILYLIGNKGLSAFMSEKEERDEISTNPNNL